MIQMLFFATVELLILIEISIKLLIVSFILAYKIRHIEFFHPSFICAFPPYIGNKEEWETNEYCN